MASAPLRNHPRMSVELFRGFREGRPDEERWELIDGVAVMMTPPTKIHQRIGNNLANLLNEALERHAPAMAAYQCTGVNLAPAKQPARLRRDRRKRLLQPVFEFFEKAEHG